MPPARALLPLLAVLTVAAPPAAPAWQSGDRQLYDNKMSLLVVLLEAAIERANSGRDIETSCLIMSIGNDVTAQYLQAAPEDREIRTRLQGLKRDLRNCLKRMQSRMGPGY
jgi:hypothetical protein